MSIDDKVNKLYDKINNSNKELIFFGLSYCEYCKKTIRLLKKKRITYKYYIIDKYFNIFFDILLKVSELFPNLEIINTHKTVPVIFMNNKFIGGFTDLEKMLNY
jgi:glutaredoxin